MPSFAETRRDGIWAGFLTFGRNMWSDVPVPRWGTNDGSTPEKRKELMGVCAADHVRFDEESAGLQKLYGYCVVRQGDLWWHDFLYISGLVEKKGVRPWIWSDYHWHHPEEFEKRMPKSVLQSNWYYGGSFDYEDPYMGEYASRAIKTYLALEKAGFDQVPCGSDYLSPKNMPETVKFCRAHIASERLKGFLIAPWHGGCLRENEEKFLSAMDCMSAAIAQFEAEILI